MLAITPPEERVGLGQGQLWEREAERAEAYYLENNYRYTNQLTLTRSILIGQAMHRERFYEADQPAVDLMPNPQAARWGASHGVRVGVAGGNFGVRN